MQYIESYETKGGCWDIYKQYATIPYYIGIHGCQSVKGQTIEKLKNAIKQHERYIDMLFEPKVR